MIKQIKKVVLCGANGFTGRFLCKELLKRRIHFLAIIRPGNDDTWMKQNNIFYKYVDLNNTVELEKQIKGYEILISLASIGFGSVPSILKACKNEKINRVIITSTTAIFTKLNSKSKKARELAEEQIRESNLNWTIIRPTMIYGSPNDRNIIKLIKWIDKYPIIPIIGNGKFLQHPIFVDDLSKVIANILKNEKTYKKIFNISGKKPLSYNKMITIIKNELKVKCISIYFPYKASLLLFKTLEKLKLKLPIKSEQVERLNENKYFNHSEAYEAFGFLPLGFDEGIKIEIKKYKTMSKI
tara:strand:- start:151 stop:1044 length:894 start_codon:yes stop_codon:yes gene_type:complete